MARKVAICAAILGIAAHFVLSMVLAFTLLSEAYRFGSQFLDAGSIGSVDQLYRLGDSPRLGFYGLALSGIADATLTTIALVWRRTRVWAWVFPPLFMLTSILICVAATAGFEVPLPVFGG